jgi:hypothetical protein
MTNSNDPQAFFGAGQNSRERYSNPFYNIPLQYLPLNIDGMLLWAEHFLFRNGFYKQALNRIANYFITSLNVECDDKEAKEKYREVMEQLRWRQILGVAGLNLLAYGNSFITVNQGFNRNLACPSCGRTDNIDKLEDFEFNKGKYYRRCPKCNFKGEHEAIDKPSNSLEKIHVVHWPAKEIKIRHEDTTGEYEYFWDIPQQYSKKVTTKNNKFYSKKTPKVIYKCIFDKKMLSFNSKNFIHLKLDTPCTIRTDGKAVPPSMFLFEDLFMLQTLKKYNEVICYEDIAPFRVISMSTENNSAANPILHQNGGVWAASVDEMIDEHRKDPGAYHKFPFPLNYQQLGGEGKNLAPVELMENFKNNILNALDIPVELFQMTLKTDSAGAALRLFENSWNVIPANYNHLLNHVADVIGKILSLPKAKVGLVPITFSDDVERKSVIGQLVSANAIARSELLNLYSFDYEDQLRKKNEEDRVAKEIQQEAADEEQFAQQLESNALGGGGGGATPQDVLSQARDIATQLYPLDGAQRRAKLQEIKATDQSLYASVKAQLEQMTSEARSSGVASSKQQATQPQ